MNKKLYAFVGPLGRINRMFETEQSADMIPKGVTQIHLTEEQHDQVVALRKEGKAAGWKDILTPDPNLEHNSVVEFVLPK
jgi:hypothetical protein